MKLETIKKTLPLLLLMTMGIMACSDNDPIEEIGTENVPELSIEAEVHHTLLCNFYQTEIDVEKITDSTMIKNPPTKFVPSVGIVLDESRPSVRSAEAETYDEACNDFMSRIPDEEDAQTLITVSDKEVCVNLGDYGSVKFSASNEDGSLAKAKVSLADARPYTLYYKPHAAFPDNGQNNQNLSKIYTPGTILYYEYHFLWFTMRSYYLVIESSSYACYVINYPPLDRYEKDHWKEITFTYSASVDQWESIRRSWRYNRDAFEAAYKAHSNIGCLRILYEIMEGNPEYQFVCVEGEDIGAHTVLWWARHTWFSWTKRIKISDLRQDKFNVEQVRFADGDKIKNKDSYHIRYFCLDRDDIKKYKILYPIN